ncbi:unnamed protein product [Amoebophrya sp. A25]|nr:unnamed protein product [Amoebophrya sp. A25]|eukprot:GSA25T00003247001.1
MRWTGFQLRFGRASTNMTVKEGKEYTASAAQRKNNF